MSYLIPELGSLLKVGRVARLLKIILALAALAVGLAAWFILHDLLGPLAGALAAFSAGFLVFVALGRLLGLNVF